MNAKQPVKIISLALVVLQTALSAAVVLSVREPSGHILGVAAACLGVAVGYWAISEIGGRRVSVMPQVRSDAELVTTGPYRWIRHPMYAALLLLVGGLACSPPAMWKCIAWCMLLFVLTIKAEIEERELVRRFPAYIEYSKRTKRILPYLF
ncbi:MAG: isoprenylcysteine carboxylmethyltransferase family protein [Planctomycetales bacterium]|nr:isoprenylcysteine carboxylmethyltransferase family protein [Planctomycetales bacterium]